MPHAAVPSPGSDRWRKPASGLAALLDQGRAVPGSGDLLDLEPLPGQRGGPSLGDILDEQRADER